MIIMHIISGGEVGGSKKHLLTLAAGMKEKNVKNVIVCFMKGKLFEEAVELGLDVRLVEQRKRVDLGIVNELAKICRDEKIDIVNCHGGRANFVGWFLMKKYSAVYATTVHSDYLEDYKGNLYKTLIYSNINKVVLKAFDCYITVSDNFKEMLISRGFDEYKVGVVYNGIDFKNKVIYGDRDSIIEKYGLDRNSKYAVIVGRFHPVKGHKVFIDACRIVSENINNTRFILVGDGNIRNELEEYVKATGFEDRFYFAGWKEPGEFFYISEFSVMASFTESFPLTILESSSYEKTVVTTDVGGVAKLIENDINGYLVNVGDYKTMADRMIELFNDDEKCKDMGKKLYEKASTHYSTDNMVESYLDIYRKITGGNKNA